MDELDGRKLIENYLRDHGVSDKDAGASRRRRDEGARNGLEKTRKGLPRKVVDLHGMTVERAEPALGRAIDECRQKGIKELLIIHGWGRHSNPAEGGILKKMVLHDLEARYTSSLRDYAPALPRDGGEGATIVRLR